MAEKKNVDETVDAPVKKAPAKKAAASKATETAAEAKAPKKAAPKKSAAKETSTEASATKPAAKATASSGTSRTPSSKPAQQTEGAGGILKVHHLRPAPGAKTAKTRVGRGEASKGKTAGRGTKGTKARNQVSAGFEGGQMPLHMRLPKLRGFKNPFRTEYQVVNLDKLSALYPDGGTVTIDDLVTKGAVRKGQLVKVLGTGELNVKLDVTVDAISGSAKDKIQAAGGTVSDS